MSSEKNKEDSFAIVIISNGPGELSTWVRPIATELNSCISLRPKIPLSDKTLRLVLVPCPNATGLEKKAAQAWEQFETITNPENFWKLLIRPNQYGKWPSKGVVVFLGGDQFWSVLLSARLGYLNMTYAEWTVRWPFWNDKILAMSSKIKKTLPKKFKKRCTIVGDLTGDLNNFVHNRKPIPQGEWVVLMPGSKAAKLRVGIPFFLEVADQLIKLKPQCKFIIPIAPTTNIDEFIYFSGNKNPITKEYSSGITRVNLDKTNKKLDSIITTNNTKIYLEEDYPSYEFISQCDLALTTIGANTAELGALNVPMIVVVPTQHLRTMNAWDGIIGIIGRIPGIKWFLSTIISKWRLRNRSFLAWPNITAKRMIVPEKVGKIKPYDIAKDAAEWLNNPDRLKGQKDDLRNLRGHPGATKAIVKEIIQLMNEQLNSNN